MVCRSLAVRKSRISVVVTQCRKSHEPSKLSMVAAIRGGQSWRGLRTTAGGADVEVAGGDGDCGRCEVMYEKGPVRVVEMFAAWCVQNTNGVVAQCPLTGLESGNEVAAANARRIAATWNACEEAGLSTEALES